MSLRNVPIMWADSGRLLSSTLCDLVRAWKIISQLSKGQVLVIDIPVLVSPFQGKTVTSWPCSEARLLQLETTLVAERRASAASISSWQYKLGWIDSSTNSDSMVPAQVRIWHRWRRWTCCRWYRIHSSSGRCAFRGCKLFYRLKRRSRCGRVSRYYTTIRWFRRRSTVWRNTSSLLTHLKQMAGDS